MNIRDLKNKNVDELQNILKESHTKLMQLRFDLADKKVKDFSQFTKTKRTIARVMTLLRQGMNTK
jgi:large subunit ribosomal protein L29